MLVADDDRRIVDANAAACLFLRRARDGLCELGLDDFRAPDPSEMRMLDGTTVAVDLHASARWRPGHHLAIIVFPADRELNDRLARAAEPGGAPLTADEREVVTLLAFGYTCAETADRLRAAAPTVEAHLTGALVKLGARNRAHGIGLALQAGELAGQLTRAPRAPRPPPP
jgi:DNA-binding CsgD family transcriptional regulator